MVSRVKNLAGGVRGPFIQGSVDDSAPLNRSQRQLCRWWVRSLDAPDRDAVQLFSTTRYQTILESILALLILLSMPIRSLSRNGARVVPLSRNPVSTYHGPYGAAESIPDSRGQSATPSQVIVNTIPERRDRAAGALDGTPSLDAETRRRSHASRLTSISHSGREFTEH